MLISIIVATVVIGITVLIMVTCWIRKRKKRRDITKKEDADNPRGTGAVYLNIHTGGERARSPNVSRSPKRHDARHHDYMVNGNGSSPVKPGNHYV